MGKFRQIFTELSARDMPIFSFLDDNLSKYEGESIKNQPNLFLGEIDLFFFGVIAL